MNDNLEDFYNVDLINYFKFIKPSLKFLFEKKNLIELEKIIDDLIDKAEQNNEWKDILNLSMKISESDLTDKLKIRILTQLNIAMYRIYNNEKLKSELEEIAKVVQWIL